MPLYEYQCKSCGHRFERIVKFSDPPEKHCPKCNGEVEQLISAPAVQFKGSGFYANDYAKKPAASGASAEKSGDGTSTSASSSGESSAPASTGESKPAAPASSEKKD